ncbi:MAG: enoyl-CoA hydratase/isomerase family protein [Desulfobacterales bacterium]|nr:enoyl-CoA hydratase/isomerase family protein [Desulfobacterales bacterium]
MSDFKFIKIESSGGVARIAFARPKHNVLNIEMMKELIAELEKLKADRELKCVVISGEGPSWCAGVEVADHKPEQVDAMIATFNRMLELIEGQEVPTIAAVHGACLGGGMEAAIACDIVVAGKSAVFGQPEIKLGFFPPYAAIRLPHLVGPGKAIEICTTGKRYMAEDAKAMGFIAICVEDGRLAETVDGAGQGNPVQQPAHHPPEQAGGQAAPGARLPRGAQGGVRSLPQHPDENRGHPRRASPASRKSANRSGQQITAKRIGHSA